LLIFESLHGFGGPGFIGEFNKSKAPLLPRFPVYREEYVGERSYGREQLPQLRFRDVKRQVPNKQSGGHLSLSYSLN
jgi:hypothetical protein